MTEGSDGIYIAWSIFGDYGTNGSLSNRQMIMFALDRLLGDNKSIKTNLPSQGIVTLTRQKSRYVCHMLYASPIKRGNGIEVIEDIIPVYDTEISIKTDERIIGAYLAPQMEQIPLEYKNGRVSVKIKRFECHQMLVLDIQSESVGREE